jgi:hypothetical protein
MTTPLDRRGGMAATTLFLLNVVLAATSADIVFHAAATEAVQTTARHIVEPTTRPDRVAARKGSG